MSTQAPVRSGGNPATTSAFKVTKSSVVLALLPVGEDGRGHTFTRQQLHDFVGRWQGRGSYPSPVVKTHDQDRDRPAVGWVENFFVEGDHLKGVVALLPEGEKAFYSTHPGWSVELVIDGNSQIDIRSLALLGKERPHFKNLTQYSQFYNEMPEETAQENEKDTLMNELVDLAESQESEINDLKQQVQEYQAQMQQYEEAAIDAESEALYAELQLYGCDCDKTAIKSAYLSMGAEVRPNYRSTLLSVAGSAKTLAKAVVNTPKLLYGEGTTEKDSLTTVKAKVKLMKLSDAYGKGAE
jgi:hypothetical protein